jgi:serine/threonine protein phosphatase 1
MMRALEFFGQWFRRGRPSRSRQRLVFSSMPAVIYAIGDVHGCISELRDLEQRIYEDSENTEGEKWIIYLGDLIDRGPKSAQVIDHVLSKEKAGIRKFCLVGNHEIEFLNYIDNGCRNKNWLTFGGVETLLSYGLYSAVESGTITVSDILGHIPSEHIDFLRELPIMITVGNYVFTHAGIDPGKNLSQQHDDVLVWSRPHEFDWSTPVEPVTVVHGHTPVETVEITSHRINVDIGAYGRGILAAVAIRDEKIDVILSH